METPDEMKKNTRKDLQSDDTISKLKRRMYSRERKGFLPWRRRRDARTKEALANDDWSAIDGPIAKASNESAQAKAKHPAGIVGLLVFSIVFFMIAGFSAVTLLNKNKDTSANVQAVVGVTIEGASTINNGGVLEMQVLVTNHNNMPLENVEILATYPDGTVSPVDFSTSLTGERITLGRVDAQSARRGTLRAVVLGRSGEHREVQVELEYMVPGSSYRYSAFAQHSVFLTEDAMSIVVQADTESTPGQAIPLIATIVSHSNTVLHGVYFDASYPFGFTVQQSTPEPEAPQSAGSAPQSGAAQRWFLGTLRPGEERRIRIVGTLDGQSGDERMLKFAIGSGARRGVAAQGIVLAKAEHKIVVRGSFLDVALMANGRPMSEYVGRAGETIDVEVQWHNTLDVPINDATIAITLGGSALNKAGIKSVRGGFYRSVDSILLWDAKTSKNILQSIPPGKHGKFTFKLTPLPKDFLQKIRAPELTFTVHAAGKRLSEQGVPELLKESSHAIVKMGTNAEIATYSLFHSSPFGQVGPLPPKVEYETTYGIVWEVSNTTSGLSNAVMRAELPHYVRWVGLVEPSDEDLTYDATNKIIEWHLGDVPAGSGTLGAAPRRVSFALGLVPSATQIGQTPTLLNNQTLNAIDTYTKKEIQKKAQDVDTKLEREQGYSGTDSRVVK